MSAVGGIAGNVLRLGVLGLHCSVCLGLCWPRLLRWVFSSVP
jgi:hypothetical protein